MGCPLMIFAATFVTFFGHVTCRFWPMLPLLMSRLWKAYCMTIANIGAHHKYLL